MKKLVSILTPCYNGAKYINRYAKSLLDQDYSNCQLIFMDDGSSDDSKELIISYKEQFEMKGFQFEYHYHENIGPGATIARGLKFVKGEYLIWPDVDDMLTPDSISKKVAYLEKRPELGLVRTRYRKLMEDCGDDMSEIGPNCQIDPSEEDLFENYLLTRGSVWLQPGCFMVRMSAFDHANPDRFIFPSRRGQNWQMLLPVLYRYKCGYIADPLYIYAIHAGSLSDSSKDTLEIVIKRYDMYEELIIETIRHMNISGGNKYIQMVHNHYLEHKFRAAINYSDKKQAKIFYRELMDNNTISIRSKLKYILIYTPLFYDLIKKIRGV